MSAGRAAPQAMKKSKANDVPVDIYVRFVRSLFNDAIILVVGAICHFVIAMLVFQKTGERIYLGLALLMLIAGLYRYYGIRKYQKAGIDDDYRSAARAESYYLIGGTFQGFFLGLFCF